MMPRIDQGRSPRLRGFTLVELLISVSLMSGVLAASYICLQAALTSRSLVEDRSDAIQTGRVIMNLIATDLRAAHRISDQHTILGLDRTLEGIEADNIDFVTRHHQPKLPVEADFCETSYFVIKNPETARFVLLRRQDPLPDDEPIAGGQREVLVEDVLGLKFEYYDGWDWYNDWGDAKTPEETTEAETASLLSAAGRRGFPDAIRISLLLPESAKRELPNPDTEFSSESPLTPPGALLFQTIVRLNLTETELESGNSATTPEGSSPSQNRQGGVTANRQ